MTTFLIIFSMLLLLSGIFIWSWYQLTRHYIEIQPDGKEKIKGDFITKYWSWFWEMPNGIKTYYYRKGSLLNKVNEIKHIFPEAKDIVIGRFDNLEFSVGLSPEQAIKIEQTLMVKFLHIGLGGHAVYYLCKEEPKYLFPYAIRFPLSQCPVCMASPYGSAIYFLSAHIYPEMFSCFIYPKIAIFLFWIVFVVILSGINRILTTKFQKYSF